MAQGVSLWHNMPSTKAYRVTVLYYGCVKHLELHVCILQKFEYIHMQIDE